MTPSELEKIFLLMSQFNVTELEIEGKVKIAKPILAPQTEIPHDFKEDTPEDSFNPDEIDAELQKFHQSYLNE